MEQKIKRITALLLGGMVLLLSALFFLLGKKEFSENENRYLEKLPAWEPEQILNGEYMSDLQSYLADHFPFRDSFMEIKTKTEMLTGKQEINGVYIAQDGFLIKEYEKPENTEQIGKILKAFAEELGIQGQSPDERVPEEQSASNQESGEQTPEKQETGKPESEWQPPEIKFMLVPTAVSIYEEKLPENTPLRSQAETAHLLYKMSGITPVDCTEDLMTLKEEGDLYYKTDHHWTTLGAYAGYQAYCREAGLDAVLLQDLESFTATEDFRGTVYSKFGDYGREGDKIIVYTNPSDKLTVNYTDTGEITDSLYNLEYTAVKDKYSLFLNNLHSLIEITNENAVSDRELVLIKDSYANSMVPFLVHHYKRIYVFDTRYYKQSVSAFIKEHPEVTDVLLLYNLDTLDKDLGVRGIY